MPDDTILLLLLAFAHVLPVLDRPLGQAAIHGLKLLAVAVVAQGLLSMVEKLTPDTPRRLIAAAAAGVVVVSGTAVVQLLAIGIGAVLGLWLCRNIASPAETNFRLRYAHRTGLVLLSVFAVLLAIENRWRYSQTESDTHSSRIILCGFPCCS